MLLNPLKFGPIYFHCKCHSIILFVNIITPSILFKNVLNVKKSPKLYKAEKQASKQTKEKVKKPFLSILLICIKDSTDAKGSVHPIKSVSLNKLGMAERKVKVLN